MNIDMFKCRLLPVFITIPTIILSAMTIAQNQVTLLPVISNDSYNGHQTTQDISAEFDPRDHTKLFSKSALFPPDASPNPSAYTVVRADIPENSPSLHNVALLQVPEEFKPGFVYLIRFVETNVNRESKGTVSWGLSSVDHYGSQWAAKGLFLGSQGNLFSAGLLESGYIDNYKPGMLIDWFVEVTDEALDIYIAMNGEGRGHAYHVDILGQNCSDTTRLRPVVGFSEGTDQAETAVISFQPVKISEDQAGIYRKMGREIPSDEEDPLNISGKWRILDASIDIESHHSNLLNQEEKNWIVVNVKWDSEKGAYAVSVKCMNAMGTSVKVLDAKTGKVNGGPVFSTRMLPPPDIMEVENYLSRTMESLDRIESSGTNNMSWITSIGQTPLRLERFVARNDRTPQHINPFCD